MNIQRKVDVVIPLTTDDFMEVIEDADPLELLTLAKLAITLLEEDDFQRMRELCSGESAKLIEIFAKTREELSKIGSISTNRPVDLATLVPQKDWKRHSLL